MIVVVEGKGTATKRAAPDGARLVLVGSDLVVVVNRPRKRGTERRGAE